MEESARNQLVEECKAREEEAAKETEAKLAEWHVLARIEYEKKALLAATAAGNIFETVKEAATELAEQQAAHEAELAMEKLETKRLYRSTEKAAWAAEEKNAREARLRKEAEAKNAAESKVSKWRERVEQVRTEAQVQALEARLAMKEINRVTEEKRAAEARIKKERKTAKDLVSAKAIATAEKRVAEVTKKVAEKESELKAAELATRKERIAREKIEKKTLDEQKAAEEKVRKETEARMAEWQAQAKAEAEKNIATSEKKIKDMTREIELAAAELASKETRVIKDSTNQPILRQYRWAEIEFRNKVAEVAKKAADLEMRAAEEEIAKRISEAAKLAKDKADATRKAAQKEGEEKRAKALVAIEKAAQEERDSAKVREEMDRKVIDAAKSAAKKASAELAELKTRAAARQDARMKAKEEARLAEEARLKAEEEARLAEEARLKAEERDRLKAEEEARLAKEARLKAEEEAHLAEEARLKALERDRLKAKEETRLAEEARLKALERDRLKAEEEACLADEARLKNNSIQEGEDSKDIAVEEIFRVFTETSQTDRYKPDVVKYHKEDRQSPQSESVVMKKTVHFDNDWDFEFDTRNPLRAKEHIVAKMGNKLTAAHIQEELDAEVEVTITMLERARAREEAKGRVEQNKAQFYSQQGNSVCKSKPDSSESDHSSDGAGWDQSLCSDEVRSTHSDEGDDRYTGAGLDQNLCGDEVISTHNDKSDGSCSDDHYTSLKDSIVKAQLHLIKDNSLYQDESGKNQGLVLKNEKEHELKMMKLDDIDSYLSDDDIKSVETFDSSFCEVSEGVETETDLDTLSRVFMGSFRCTPKC